MISPLPHEAQAALNEPELGSETAARRLSPPPDPQAGQEPPEQQNACKYAKGRFELTRRGVLFIGTDKEGGPQEPVWVCSPLRVTAKTRDVSSGAWGRLLEWTDDDGVNHQWATPLELLECDGTDVRRELARQGLQISPTRTARDLLAAYIKVSHVHQRACCVERLGWHGDVFVTPTQTFGDAAERIVFQNTHATEPAMHISGTVADWREGVAALAAGNTRLVFALAVAFAAPLADIAGEDAGGFHLRGKSSSGKSTALKVAASLWGRPDTYVRLWRSTINGLEGLASLHNDGLLILDELSQCDPRDVGEAAYLLANGQGKARATRVGTARAAYRWRVLFLSAGEESLVGLMARAGTKVSAGQEIRLADIDADAGAGMGLLECLHGHPHGASLVQALKDSAAQCHGAAGWEWLQYLVQQRGVLAETLKSDMRRFVADLLPDPVSGQAQRVARRFALVAAAGELATRCGLTGWTVGESERAARACFLSWQESFGSSGDREERAMLAQVRAFFELHGASRFENAAQAGEHRIHNRAGFFRDAPDGTRHYLVLPEVFRREICAGFHDRTMVRLLVGRGWIEPGGDGRVTQKPRLQGLGTAIRLYAVNGRLLWEHDAD